MPTPAVRVKVSIADIRQWTGRLKGKLNAEFVPRIMQTAQEAAKPKILPILIDAFEGTIAVQGILGRNFDPDTDVQAHLGIENPDQTWGEMVDAISKSLRVRRTNLGLTVFATNIIRNLGKIPSGEYASNSRTREAKSRAFGDSQAGGIPIDWMNWLLSGESRPMDYHIVFVNDDESRSGRALMKHNRKSGDKEWTIEDYNAFAEQGKDTFVHEALEGEKWPLEIQRVVVKLIKDICLKNRR